MILAGEPNLTSKVDLDTFDEACKAAEKFSDLYYENFDKHRHKLGMFYMADASLVWNGNGINGKSEIITFYENLPTSSTDVKSLDAQPIFPHDGNEKAILVRVSGSCQFDKKPPQEFFQTFRLCAVSTEGTATWKVTHDTLRIFK